MSESSQENLYLTQHVGDEQHYVSGLREGLTSSQVRNTLLSPFGLTHNFDYTKSCEVH